MQKTLINLPPQQPHSNLPRTWLNTTSGNARRELPFSTKAAPSINPDSGGLVVPRVFTQALDVAETTGKIMTIPGNLIIIPWATDSTVLVGVTYHDVDRHEPINAGKNFFRGGFRFTQFVLTWGAQAGKSIQFEVYDDPSPLQQIRVE